MQILLYHYAAKTWLRRLISTRIVSLQEHGSEKLEKDTRIQYACDSLSFFSSLKA